MVFVNTLKQMVRWGGCAIALVLAAALSGAGAETYQTSGLVVTVNPQQGEFVVSTEEIPGVRDAMEMTLPVLPKSDLVKLRPGIIVDFKLIVSGKSAHAEEVRERPFVNFDYDPQAAARFGILKQSLPGRSSLPAELKIGQSVPDFTLTDQNKDPVSLADFRGKIVALTFVYASCPFPNYCFRLSNNFGQLQKRFGSRMGRDLILLTITLDPIHDQPATLQKYGKTWRAGAGWWHFLTGEPEKIEEIKSRFGVVANPDMEMIAHSLHTVIINRQGVLTVNLEGNEFTSKQLGDLVDAQLNRPPEARSTDK